MTGRVVREDFSKEVADHDLNREKQQKPMGILCPEAGTASAKALG